ncbi:MULTISPECIES: anaerobic ribonucleoside-triphosphate reductase activating protein [Terrabacteria group]|uniref:anaerobic ribonucleoside-triphosphate reductase activating protein n=1 Tax=Bacillati TaxID=1783272 RepID=UPI00193962BD|nr:MULTISPECIES: anaerobic ribonucleoside-triphosphate reductase activating protein [Terrabacteria group]MBW9213005.1 anaerobic ribonucleoside-triphosphate reductase activating protein [Trueperella sp. zg.1013]QRG87047.1 anaerobic ribonucleoside-triphosphate reductase activating protein [Bulleidia sp. zg-1006]
MYYGNIKEYDIADGPGIRVSIFVSGCTNRCKGCFNVQTWNFCYGKPYTEETKNYILEAMNKPYIEGLTLLGGEPFELENQKELVKLLREAKKRYPEKNYWSYTGFVYDRDLVTGGRRYGYCTDEMLDLLDVLVDGPFMWQKKNIQLQFRGSENQRLIDLKKTRKSGKVVLFEPK